MERRFAIPHMDRGGLDILPVLARYAGLLAVLLGLSAFTQSYRDPWYFLAANLSDGTLAALLFAVVLSLFAGHSYRFLDRRHDVFVREMEHFAEALRQ